MLSPEVCFFPAPRVTRSVLLQAKPEEVVSTARSNIFYHTIAVLCPDEYKVPDSILNVVCRDSDFYKLTGCPASELINKQFIEKFLLNGNIAALSVNTHCDIDNCAAITEDGVLVLHVVDRLYQELGLEGTKSSRHFVDIYIDLKSEKLKSAKYYQRIETSLQKLGSFDLIIKWKPPSQDICPSSIAKYFYDRNVDVSTCATRVKVERRDVERVPRLSEDELSEAVEWVGAVATGVDLQPAEPFISTYMQPTQQDHVDAAHAALFVATGLFTSNTIINLHAEVDNYNKSRDETHWTVLSYQCFTDAPWGSHSRPKYQAVDATYTIFTQNTGNIIHKSIAIK